MRVFPLIAMLCVFLAACREDNALPQAPTEEEVWTWTQAQGWEIDTRLAEHQKATPEAGVGYPLPDNVDEAWTYGQTAWGIPARLASKVYRYAHGRPSDPAHAVSWLDSVAVAAHSAELPPKVLLRVYWDHRQQFSHLGFSFQEAIAIVAGMAKVEREEWKLHKGLDQALDLLSDEEFMKTVQAKGVALQSSSGKRSMWDILGDLDRLQCQHAYGANREKHWNSLAKSEINAGLVLMLDGQSRKIACDLVGRMKCATGKTYMQLDKNPLPAEGASFEYGTTTSLVEHVARIADR